MLCKILRSAAKNGSPNRFFNALVRIPNFKLPFKKNDRIIPIVFLAARVQVRLNYCHTKLLPSVLECFNL